VPAPALDLGPLTRADFDLLAGWLARPHVAAWWGPPTGRAGVEREFGPCIDGTDPTLVFIVSDATGPLGLVQCYRLADNPDYAAAVGLDDAAGIDLLIGDPERCGAGLGPATLTATLEVAWAAYPEVAGAMAGPSVFNLRSHRAFEKAGFTRLRQVSVPGEDDDEVIFYRPRPTAG
jgi:aminoglycoside 6'-N-acetyltransferase